MGAAVAVKSDSYRLDSSTVNSEPAIASDTVCRVFCIRTANEQVGDIAAFDDSVGFFNFCYFGYGIYAVVNTKNIFFVRHFLAYRKGMSVGIDKGIISFGHKGQILHKHRTFKTGSIVSQLCIFIHIAADGIFAGKGDKSLMPVYGIIRLVPGLGIVAFHVAHQNNGGANIAVNNRKSLCDGGKGSGKASVAIFVISFGTYINHIFLAAKSLRRKKDLPRKEH